MRGSVPMRAWMMALALSAALPAAADEVWETAEGPVVYLSDVGDVAVWEAETLDGTLRFYFPGLAGRVEGRDVHHGYWIQVAGQGCGATLTGPDGFAGPVWGRVTLIFHQGGFPTDWTMRLGTCFDAPDASLRGASPMLRQP